MSEQGINLFFFILNAKKEKNELSSHKKIQSNINSKLLSE